MAMNIYKTGMVARPAASSPQRNRLIGTLGGALGGGTTTTTAPTNMGPKGFTPAQKAQINARMKKKAASVIRQG